MLQVILRKIAILYTGADVKAIMNKMAQGKHLVTGKTLELAMVVVS